MDAFMFVKAAACFGHACLIGAIVSVVKCGALLAEEKRGDRRSRRRAAGLAVAALALAVATVLTMRPIVVTQGHELSDAQRHEMINFATGGAQIALLPTVLWVTGVEGDEVTFDMWKLPGLNWSCSVGGMDGIGIWEKYG